MEAHYLYKLKRRTVVIYIMKKVQVTENGLTAHLKMLWNFFHLNAEQYWGYTLFHFTELL